MALTCAAAIFHPSLISQEPRSVRPRIPYGCVKMEPKIKDKESRSSIVAMEVHGQHLCSLLSRNSLEQVSSESSAKQQSGNDVVQADPVVYSSLLRHSGDARDLSAGKRIHCHIIYTGHEHNVFLGNLLVQMYGKCGVLMDARNVFDRARLRNVFSWTIMLDAYVQHGQAEEGLLLFHRMQLEGVVPDKVMCLSILEACGSLADLSEGQRTHACIVCCGFEADVVVGTALVHMYGKCGSRQDLSRMFCKMPERNVVSWNAMIAAHAQHGQSKEALNLFQQMKLQGMFPNRATFLSILEACVNQATTSNCQEMHTEIILAGLESEVAVGTALVYMYGKCGWIEDAERLLDKMLKRDIIAWNAMIAAYALHQLGKQALQLFWQMQLEGMIPDKSTYSSLLDACANKAALAEGKQVHALVLESGLDSSPIVGTAIVNMYGKCGCLQDAMCFFNRMRDRDVIAWSAVIAAHAQQGQGKEAVKLFQEMQSEGVVPNDITYFSILSACSHAGLMVEGQYFFQTMTESHAISPTVQHYNCMIDLLGRVGRLDEGELLISRMAVQPNATSWLTLLSACRRHSDVERGKRVAQRLLDLDPERTAAYVLLSNMYAENGMVNELPMLMHPVEGTELN